MYESALSVRMQPTWKTWKETGPLAGFFLSLLYAFVWGVMCVCGVVLYVCVPVCNYFKLPRAIALVLRVALSWGNSVFSFSNSGYRWGSLNEHHLIPREARQAARRELQR